jgi:hypothetical protein
MADGLTGWKGFVDPEREEWRDFFAAEFHPLDEHNQEFAGRLAERFVRRFLRVAGFSDRRYQEAVDAVVISRGTTPAGKLLLQVELPLTGSMAMDWDGSPGDAESIIDDIADTKAGTIELDRKVAGPTGWEPEFD